MSGEEVGKENVDSRPQVFRYIRLTNLVPELLNYVDNSVLDIDNGKEYAVVSSCTYENNIYIYIVNLENENDTKICRFLNNEITEILDEDLVDELSIMLLDKLSED